MPLQEGSKVKKGTWWTWFLFESSSVFREILSGLLEENTRVCERVKKHFFDIIGLICPPDSKNIHSLCIFWNERNGETHALHSIYIYPDSFCTRPITVGFVWTSSYMSKKIAFRWISPKIMLLNKLFSSEHFLSINNQSPDISNAFYSPLSAGLPRKSFYCLEKP